MVGGVGPVGVGGLPTVVTVAWEKGLIKLAPYLESILAALHSHVVVDVLIASRKTLSRICSLHSGGVAPHPL